MGAARSVRFLTRVDEGVRALARRSGRDASSIVNELLDEGLRMRRIPGIAFGDGGGGRVARIAGTGVDVWGIARSFRELGDREALANAYQWLSDQQLRAALAYAEAYPDEISRRIQADEEWTPETIWETHPFMRPDWRR
ncbi:MAG: DUF433 domain-containing protein [Chloroflexota bacterium]|nr:MAG: DUF433 domain-containing protein [Chloroflexota bacterium]